MPEASENLGTKLILENDRVRIWEHRVPSGETGPTHLHRRPYLSVVVRGSSGDTLDPSGTVVEHFTFEAGATYWIGDEDLPQTHALHNTGDEEILIVTTEFL